MKRIFIFLSVVAMSLSSMAQTPENISYQAVIRNAENQLMTNQEIGLKISILQDSDNGDIVFEEKHVLTTNANGLVNLSIGTGTPIIGTLSEIDWSSATYFIQTSTDTEGGENYTVIGTSALMSVPYALHAKSVETISETDPLFTTWDKSTGIIISETQISDLQNYLVAETDPLFNASIAAGIDAADTANWNNKLDSYTETDPQFNSKFDFTGEQQGSLITYDDEIGKWKPFTHDFAMGGHGHNNASTTADGFMSATDKTKFDGIAEGAEVNVNADWNANEGDAQILNKPDLTVFATKDMNNTNITNLATPLNEQDAATKAYVDALEERIQLLEVKMALSEGVTLTELLADDVPVRILLNAGISIADLITAGVSLIEIYNSGATVQEMINAGVSVSDLASMGIGASDLIAANASIAEMIAAGFTNSSEYIGKVYRGGIIFHVNFVNGTGLLCAMQDQSTGIQWGPFTTTSATGTAIGTGSSNTETIVSVFGEGSYAAKLCSDLELNGYDDWFLPSKDEINLMYTNMQIIDNTAIQNNGTPFAKEIYWSSTEGYANRNAWYLNFLDGTLTNYVGNPFNYNKTTPYRVRAIRAF